MSKRSPLDVGTPPPPQPSTWPLIVFLVGALLGCILMWGAMLAEGYQKAPPVGEVATASEPATPPEDQIQVERLHTYGRLGHDNGVAGTFVYDAPEGSYRCILWKYTSGSAGLQCFPITRANAPTPSPETP